MSRREPIVSVVMPAYNCERYIADALRSLQAQSFADFEVQVVDNGSTDGTVQVARHIADSDERIKVMSQVGTGSPSGPRNAGLSRARGDLVTFLDADDLFAPEKLAREVDIFSRFPETDIVFADVFQFRNVPENVVSYALRTADFVKRAGAEGFIHPVEQDVYRCRGDFYRFMTRSITAINTQTVMFRRELLKRESVWFDPGLRIGEDIDFWFRLARDARMMFIDQPLAYYRMHDASITQDRTALLEGFIEAHTRNLTRARDRLSDAEVGMCQKRLASAWFELGYRHWKARRATQARDAARQSMTLGNRAPAAVLWLKSWLPNRFSEWLRGKFDAVFGRR